MAENRILQLDFSGPLQRRKDNLLREKEAALQFRARELNNNILSVQESRLRTLQDSGQMAARDKAETEVATLQPDQMRSNMRNEESLIDYRDVQSRMMESRLAQEEDALKVQLDRLGSVMTPMKEIKGLMETGRFDLATKLHRQFAGVFESDPEI